MPGRSLKATPSGNDRKHADLNSEEAAVRSRNMAATQNFLDRLRGAGHDPDEVFASSVGGGDQPARGREGGQGRLFASRAVRHLLQSSSASRFTAAQAGFFILSQGERPLR